MTGLNMSGLEAEVRLGAFSFKFHQGRFMLSKFFLRRAELLLSELEALVRISHTGSCYLYL